jgi:hypothetical protein
MSTGSWLNQDGLYLQFGTSKAIPEAGGDYLVYGDNREIEVLINLGTTAYGSKSGQTGALNPALPSSFQGTVASQTATANTGIVSFTTFFPLQVTAPVTVANTSGVLQLNNPQLAIDSVELETLVSANAGTGSATGLTGIGLVIADNSVTPSRWVQVTPNAGTQLMGAVTNAQMTAGKRFTFYPDGTAIGTGTPPTAGDWVGTTTNGLQVPLVTNALTPLPNNAYISAIASGGTFTGSSGGGLIKLRIKYYYYGTINY